MATLSHARFERLASPSARTGTVLSVPFNPTEYTLSKANQWAEVPIPGLDSPIVQFVRGQTETLSLELFFDSTEDGTGATATPVTDKTDAFYDLIKIDSDTHAPPVLLFSWGGPTFPGRTRSAFRCVVQSVKQQFTLFSPQGVPLRAKLTVELREYKTLTQQLDELNLKSADHTKATVVTSADDITSIATRAYGDPRQWRLIAESNGIVDPLHITPGTVLRLPRAV